MFGPLLLPVFAYLVYRLRLLPGTEQRTALRQGFGWAAGLLVGLLLFGLLLGLGISLLPEVGNFYMSTLAANNRLQIFAEAIVRRVISPGGWITLLLLLGVNLGLLLRLNQQSPASSEEIDSQKPLAMTGRMNEPTIFVLLLVLLGGLLVLGPEFVYLRDLFGWRMNTIFKFYFQAWLVWSLAAAYASAVLLRRLRGAWGVLFSLGWVALVVASLAYPVFSLWSKTNGFKPGEWTLDSTLYYRRQAPDEMAAIDWLSRAPLGVVAEAVPAEGGSYSQYARVATFSGQPGVLGWVGHENQWRGGDNPTGSRQSDLQRLYCSRDWKESRDILERYDIRYVMVSPLERSTYKADASLCPLGVVDTKFQRNLTTAFQLGQVTVYEYTAP
jgi:uncharacterized membrane protein